MHADILKFNEGAEESLASTVLMMRVVKGRQYSASSAPKGIINGSIINNIIAAKEAVIPAIIL